MAHSGIFFNMLFCYRSYIALHRSPQTMVQLPTNDAMKLHRSCRSSLEK